MKKLNFLLIIFFVFLIHYFEGFKNIYKISKRDYISRMERTHGYCNNEAFGFYNQMVKKYNINKYEVIQQNYEVYPLLRGFFYEKELKKDKKFLLILNYPDSNLPDLIEVEGKKINLNEIKLLEQKKNCYLYIFKK